MADLNEPHFLNSFTAPQDILDEITQNAEENEHEQYVNSVTQNATMKQIVVRQSHSRFGTDSPYPLSLNNEVDGGYNDAMRLAILEWEEERVLQVIQTKEKREREVKMDLDKTPPAHELKDAILEFTPRSTTSRKRRWDVEETEPSTLKRRRSRWDQAPTKLDFPRVPILMTIPTISGNDYGQHLTDEALNGMFPDGYVIVTPPRDYTRQDSTLATSLFGFRIQESSHTATQAAKAGITPEVPAEIPGVGALTFFKAEDSQYFSKIMKEEDETELSIDEMKERKILRLLLKIKNGTPPVRKTALRQITDKAREFGAGPLFDKILPLLMERTLEDQERHILVKVIDHVLYKLDDLVRPYVHKILVVIEPLLIDEDYYARVEGREIISNLSKAAGLAHMISTMRPDIDHADEYVRNTTARAFSVVASALGIPSLLPFLKAVCRSKKSWQARHTGIRIIQQIAITMGCSVLPHLHNLVECVASGLSDDQQKVRTMTALSLAALAAASTPYGIEAFDVILKPLTFSVGLQRGKPLAASLKALGHIIPLMDSEYALDYMKKIMPILIREFQSSDEEMRRIVLVVLKQCAETEGVTSDFLKATVIPAFFKAFWIRRMALDKRSNKLVIETTVRLSQKTGAAEIVGRVVDGLKDDAEPYRQMAMETITNIFGNLGATDFDERLEVRLVDGVISSFQEQTLEDSIMLNGFGAVVNCLSLRAKPYLMQIVSMVLWRLNNKSAKVRQQAADLATQLVSVLQQCGEDHLLAKLGLVLFELLGEEYPDTLGSIVTALGAIISVVGMSQMNPPVKDLLPRMAPILRNRHEKVQEASINVIGRIADRGAEYVSAREWMRICFELLDLLKAHKKSIRRAATNTFGYIAKSLGPQEVLSVLLTNLRVQDRQSRVTSSIAMAIVAETCGAFTCIPAILNEYRSPELNVRTGCLKALTFVFEYIGSQSVYYIDTVVPMLEDALTERDAVHRQTASTIVKHLALNVAGLRCEDAVLHLLNLVWPNCFETSPHVINAVMNAIEAMRIAVGPGILLSYMLQGLFHPSRRVREVYWRMYNELYLGAQDSLVPFYPDLGELSEKNIFHRTPLQVVI